MRNIHINQNFCLIKTAQYATLYNQDMSHYQNEDSKLEVYIKKLENVEVLVILEAWE